MSVATVARRRDVETSGSPPFAGIEPEPRYVAPDGYQIRHDADAPAKICRLLLEGWRDAPGEPVLLTRELGTSDVWAIHTIIEALRRVGHLIDGERGVPGYTYRGFAPPPKWLHIDKVLRDVVAEQLREDERMVLDGQMRLEDAR